MNATIARSYDVIVYPHENDCDEYCAFSITPKVINSHTLRIFLSYYNDFENPLYLGLCDDSVWFIDTEHYHGLTIPFPETADDVYDYLIEIDDYDEEQSAVLAETVFLLYHDILKPLRLPTSQ